jgi:hypothetical protein
MYYTHKSKSICLLAVGFSLIVSTLLVSPVSAVDLPFDPNKCGFYAE